MYFSVKAIVAMVGWEVVVISSVVVTLKAAEIMMHDHL